MNKEGLIGHFQGTDVDIINILKAQEIAKKCLDHMKDFLRPGLNQEQIHEECESFMFSLGSEGWWIHDDPALILFNDLSTYSGPGLPDYRNKVLKEDDFITIDVAPMIRTGWGDLARSFILENGKIIDWKETKNDEIRQGMELELELHERFVDFVDVTTSFEDLHRFTQDFLERNGYHNCDYHGNFGHTVENHSKDRITIDKGVKRCIAAYGKPITFEPHICKNGGKYGIKHEDMYVFYEGKMRKL
ncbi:MAG: aminopeptidase P family protein [Erysipelotrichaceae bacterium]|nr:aminopeptidase P family protein [Erysipelotrichaceae bacterium]